MAMEYIAGPERAPCGGCFIFAILYVTWSVLLRREETVRRSAGRVIAGSGGTESDLCSGPLGASELAIRSVPPERASRTSLWFEGVVFRLKNMPWRYSMQTYLSDQDRRNLEGYSRAASGYNLDRYGSIEGGLAAQEECAACCYLIESSAHNTVLGCRERNRKVSVCASGAGRTSGGDGPHSEDAEYSKEESSGRGSL